MKGIYSLDIPLMEADTSGLSGGADNSPTITISKYREATKNLLFEPIPNDMLFMAASKPQVVMTIGDGESGYVTSVCMVEDGEGCDYTTDSSKNLNMNAFTHDISSVGDDMLTV